MGNSKNMSHYFGPNLTPSLPFVTNCHTWATPYQKYVIIPPPNCMRDPTDFSTVKYQARLAMKDLSHNSEIQCTAQQLNYKLCNQSYRPTTLLFSSVSPVSIHFIQ